MWKTVLLLGLPLLDVRFIMPNVEKATLAVKLDLTLDV